MAINDLIVSKIFLDGVNNFLKIILLIKIVVQVYIIKGERVSHNFNFFQKCCDSYHKVELPLKIVLKELPTV